MNILASTKDMSREEWLEVTLTRDLRAKVDIEDLAKVSHFKWCAKRSGNRYYAVAYIKGGGRRCNKQISMHRLILNYYGPMDVDHINGNQLDNRKCNLRIVTRSQNNLNQQSPRGGSSRYKGVYFDKRKNRFVAELTISGERVLSKQFKNEIDAAKAYDEAAKKHCGEHAYLNFRVVNN